jgi:hypothetical protein
MMTAVESECRLAWLIAMRVDETSWALAEWLAARVGRGPGCLRAGRQTGQSERDFLGWCAPPPYPC